MLATPKDSYMTLEQGAEYTNFGTRTLRRYIAEGKLVAYRAGRAIRLKKSDLDALFTRTDSWAGGAA